MPDFDDPQVMRGTTRAVEERVARLERQFDTLDGKVDVMGLQMERISTEQNHISQLITTQHQAITAELALLRSRWHETYGQIQTVIADANASPAGRYLLKSVEEVKVDTEKMLGDIKSDMRDVKAETEKSRTWIAVAGGITVAIVTILTLIGPYIRDVLRIPT